MIDPSVFCDILEVRKSLLEEEDFAQIISLALDIFIKMAKAENGLVFLFNYQGHIPFILRRNRQKKTIKESGFDNLDFAEEIVCNDNQFFNSIKANGDILDFSKYLRKKYHQLPPCIIFPFLHSEKLCGILYLEYRNSVEFLNKDDIKSIQNLIDILAIDFPSLKNGFIPPKFNNCNKESFRSNFAFDAIIGTHPKLLDILQVVSQIADTDVPVLIEGETGTGKELIARAIHLNSQRKNNPMISVNCSAFPENLLESEFFGYVRGAFTGAARNHRGKFETANEGTIFLDEVDEMSLTFQVKLLRILQWGEFSPLGSEEIKRVNVRVIAAAKEPLNILVKDGKFRDDLYYRLNLLKIELPPLRERKEDILQLAYHFLTNFKPKNKRLSLIIDHDAQRLLQNYNYPGNVRELENVIKRAAILCKGNTIRSSDLPKEVRNYKGQECIFDNQLECSFKEAKRKVIDQFEKSYIEQALIENKGVISRAARKAGMHPKNFREKLKIHQIGFKELNLG